MYYLSVEAVELDEVTRETVREESQRRELCISLNLAGRKRKSQQSRGVGF